MTHRAPRTKHLPSVACAQDPTALTLPLCSNLRSRQVRQQVSCPVIGCIATAAMARCCKVGLDAWSGSRPASDCNFDDAGAHVGRTVSPMTRPAVVAVPSRPRRGSRPRTRRPLPRAGANPSCSAVTAQNCSPATQPEPSSDSQPNSGHCNVHCNLTNSGHCNLQPDRTAGRKQDQSQTPTIGYHTSCTSTSRLEGQQLDPPRLHRQLPPGSSGRHLRTRMFFARPGWQALVQPDNCVRTGTRS